MNLSLSLVGLLVFMGIMYNSISSDIFRTNKETKYFSAKTMELQFSNTQYNLAKKEIENDTNWTGCEGAYRLCNDYNTNYYPIYSPITDSAMKNVEEGNLKNTIWFEPINKNYAILMSETKSPEEKTIIGYLIKKGTAIVYNFPPILYGEDSYNLNNNIKFCSYTLNAEGSLDETNTVDPSFSYYIRNTNNLLKSSIINNNNNSNAELFIKGKIDYKPEYLFKKVIASDNIVLEPDTNLFLAYSNNNIKFKDNANATNFEEYGDFQYPEFEEIEKNNISTNSTTDLSCKTNNSKFVYSKNYRNVKIDSGCKLYLHGNVIINNLQTINTNGNPINIYIYDNINLNIKDFTINGGTRINLHYFGSNKIPINTEDLNIKNGGVLDNYNSGTVYFKSNNINLGKNTKLISTTLSNNFNVEDSSTSSLFNSNNQKIVGNTISNNVNINLKNTTFCNIITTDNNSVSEIDPLDWNDFSYSNSGPGNGMNNIVMKAKSFICSDKKSCEQRILNYYNNNIK